MEVVLAADVRVAEANAAGEGQELMDLEMAILTRIGRDVKILEREIPIRGIQPRTSHHREELYRISGDRHVTEREEYFTQRK